MEMGKDPRKKSKDVDSEFSRSDLSSDSDNECARKRALFRRQGSHARRHTTIKERSLDEYNAEAVGQKKFGEEEVVKPRRKGVSISPAVPIMIGYISSDEDDSDTDANSLIPTCSGDDGVDDDRETDISGISPRNVRNHLPYLEELSDASVDDLEDATHVSATSDVQSICNDSTRSTLERKYERAVREFRTDQYTLSKRLEHQERARDVAVSGMDKELRMLASTITELEGIPTTSTDIENPCILLRTHDHKLNRQTLKLLEKSVVHGRYKKEKMLATNMKTMIEYIEQLQEQLNKLSGKYGDALTQ